MQSVFLRRGPIENSDYPEIDRHQELGAMLGRRRAGALKITLPILTQ